MTIAFMHNILSDETSRELLALGLMALGLGLVCVAGWLANLVIDLRGENKRLRADNARLRPLAEVTEVQTATARLLVRAAGVDADEGQGGADALTKGPAHRLPIPTDTNKEAPK